MTEQFQSFLDRMLDLFTAGVLSVFGGSAAYVYKSVKEETGFRVGQFLINAFLAFFIGNVVGGFIPKDSTMRDGILMLAGFSTWPILNVMEIYGRKFILNYVSKQTGTDVTVSEAEIAEEKKAIAEAQLAEAKAKAELKEIDSAK